MELWAFIFGKSMLQVNQCYYHAPKQEGQTRWWKEPKSILIEIYFLWPSLLEHPPIYSSFKINFGSDHGEGQGFHFPFLFYYFWILTGKRERSNQTPFTFLFNIIVPLTINSSKPHIKRSFKSWLKIHKFFYDVHTLHFEFNIYFWFLFSSQLFPTTFILLAYF